MRAVATPPGRQRRRLARLEQPRWLIIPIGVTLIVLAVLIVLVTPREHLLGAALAYVNLLIIGVAAVHFVQRRTLQGLIPVLFLAWFAAGWQLPTIYFAALLPDVAYYPMADQRECLFGAVRLQTVAFVFLSTYLATVFLFEGRYPPWTSLAANQRIDRRVGAVVLWVVTAAITVHAVSQVVALPAVLQYVASGSYNYLHGLMLMVGVLFLRLTVQTRLRAVLFLSLAGAFYLIGNARALAMLPATLFVVGLILLSEISQTYKTWTIVAVCVGIPLALVFGNTTRTLLGSIGFQDLGTRLSALGEWQEVFRRTPVLAATFQRLFFVGGHSIIAYTPEHFPYVDFSPTAYGWEFLTRLLPGKLFYEPFYSSNARLKTYGFVINDQTSTPISLLGSLYLLGGIVPVGVGAFAMGLVHCVLGRLIGRASRRTPYLGLFIFSMIASILIWSQNVDLITNVRVILWRLLSAFVLYILILRPLVAHAAARPLAPRSIPGPSPAWRRPPFGSPSVGAAALASAVEQRRMPSWKPVP
jgi:hypothetical protein